MKNKIISRHNGEIRNIGDSVIMNTLTINCNKVIRKRVLGEITKEIFNEITEEILNEVIGVSDYVFFPYKLNSKTEETDNGKFATLEIIYGIEQYSFDDIQNSVYAYLSEIGDEYTRRIVLMQNFEFLKNSDKNEMKNRLTPFSQ